MCPSTTARWNTEFARRTTSASSRPFLPAKYSPLQTNGDGLQSVYLAELSEPLAQALIGLIGQAYWDAYATIADDQTASDSSEPDQNIIDRGIVGPTFRNQVVKSRRGQGVFRANVLLRESSCRVTRVGDSKHLKASHIKPWRDATDTERLDGSNGLLLSPHVDHLFDKGYITFSASQSLIIVPEVRDKLLDAWGIDAGVRVGDFSREQNGLPRLSPRQRVQGGPHEDVAPTRSHLAHVFRPDQIASLDKEHRRFPAAKGMDRESKAVLGCLAVPVWSSRPHGRGIPLDADLEWIWPLIAETRRRANVPIPPLVQPSSALYRADNLRGHNDAQYRQSARNP